VAWEIFAGKRLYQGDDITLVFKVATETPPRLRTVAPTVSEELEDVVAKALTIDRTLRWATAAEFSKALAAAYRKTAPLAEYDEVADVVKAVAGPKLAERRAAVSKLLQLRRQIGEVVLSAPTSTPSLVSVSSTSEASVEIGAALVTERVTTPLLRSELPRTDTTSVSGPEISGATTRDRRRRQIVAASFGALVLAGLGVLVLARGGSRSEEATQAASAQVTPAPVASVDLTAVPSESSVAPPSVPSPPPAQLLDAGARIDAVADDGRKASTRAAPTATSVRTSFPPRAAPPPPTPAPTPTGMGVRPPPLAPDPYRR
jgi:serine/threonine-protein kinase